MMRLWTNREMFEISVEGRRDGCYGRKLIGYAMPNIALYSYVSYFGNMVNIT